MTVVRESLSVVSNGITKLSGFKPRLNVSRASIRETARITGEDRRKHNKTTAVPLSPPVEAMNP